MCDYSLEMYRTRPAVTGERYETRRFASGTVGFIAPGDPSTAVCMACDTRLELADLPEMLRQRLGLPPRTEATFVRIEMGPHHDGVRFAGGAELTLQELGAGVTASVIDALSGDRRPDWRVKPELVTVA